MGKPIVMGRKTYDSIGRPLPGRQNIVITRNPGFVADGCDVVSSADAAVAVAGDAEEVMIIGGSHIYQAFLPRADRIYLTRVHTVIDGDTFLTSFDETDWLEISTETYEADDANAYSYSFVTYDRRGA